MYKFTNGIVVFDEKTRDAYVKAGYKLVNNKVDKKVDNKIEKQLVDNNEENDENSSNDGTIEEKHTRDNKKASKNK